MRVVVALLILSCGLTNFSARASDASGIDFDTQICRYLQESQFVPSMKHGIRTEIAKQGKSNPFLEKVLAAKDEDIIRAVSPVFKSYLNPEEARALAEFYSSETAKAITRQQAANLNNPNPPLHLTSAQEQQYDQFVVSPGGKAAIRLNAAQQQQDYWQRMNQAIQSGLK